MRPSHEVVPRSHVAQGLGTGPAGGAKNSAGTCWEGKAARWRYG